MIAKRDRFVRPMGVPRAPLRLVRAEDAILPSNPPMDRVAKLIVGAWYALGIAAWVVALWWMLA